MTTDTARRDLRSTVVSSTRAVDVALLAAVPLALVAVFALPATTRAQFVLDYRSPSLVDMYVSHFVHFSVPHLAANLAAYALAVVPAYWYCAVADRRSDFRVTFGVVLVAFPFVLSGLNVVFVRPRVGYGFSGLAMAYLGFVPIALVAFVRARLFPAVTLDHAPLLFFAGAGTVAALAVLTTTAEPVPALAALGVAVFGTGVYGASLYRAVGYEGFRRAIDQVGDVEFAAAGVVLVVTAPFVVFPSQVVVDGTVLNVYTHLLGYCLGFIAPYVTLRATAPLPD